MLEKLALTISGGIDFVRKNPTMLYSFLLIFAVTGIIFYNSAYIIEKYEWNTSKILQSKAGTAGIIFSAFSSEILSDKEKLKEKIDSIRSQDLEIKAIAILEPKADGEGFSSIVSTGDDKYFENNKLQALYGISWIKNDAAATIGGDENGRLWNIVSIIRGDDGKKLGLVLTSFSWSKWDELSVYTIRKVYVVTFISLIIVLLIIINHARLFKYELKATKLEEVDKMKDDFISMASHELRSPLTAISGYVELLKDGIDEKDKKKLKDRKKYVDNIGISAERLQSLVEDILNVSRLDQNRLPIKNEKIALVPIVKVLVDEMQISADEKKLKLINKLKKSSFVSADSERIKQVLVNLISNAIKYTPSGKIEIKSQEDEKFVYVIVADTGLGMSSQDMKNLFSKFYRIKTNETSGISGTGLGLWISREIALKMGGDLGVESIEGVGSHFTFKIKKA